MNNLIYNNLRYLNKIKTYKIYSNSNLNLNEGVLEQSNTPVLKAEVKGCINIVKKNRRKEEFKNDINNVISGIIFDYIEIKKGDLIEKDSIKYTIRDVQIEKDYIYIYAY